MRLEMMTWWVRRKLSLYLLMACSYYVCAGSARSSSACPSLFTDVSILRICHLRRLFRRLHSPTKRRAPLLSFHISHEVTEILCPGLFELRKLYLAVVVGIVFLQRRDSTAKDDCQEEAIEMNQYW